MSSQETLITTHSVETPSGRISYASAGSGPAALFVHGVVLNKHLWRHQLAGLSDVRRCIAVDVLAQSDTEIVPDQDVSVTANAKMLKEVLDALKIDQVDLVGNDSAGGIQAVCRYGQSRRPARHVGRDARRQDNLSFTRRAWAGL